MQICVAIPNQLLQLKSEPVAEAEAIAESLHTSLVTYITLVTKRRLVQQALVEPKLPAHPLRPGGPVRAPDPASPYARATTSRARTRLMHSKALISTAPSPSTWLNLTTPTKIARRRSRRQVVCPPRNTHPE